MPNLRYALRLLRKSPGFSSAVILTVAIGIGATTGIFSVVNAVLLRPLPFAEPGRLVQVAEKNDRLHLPNFAASVLNYLAWKEQTQTFSALGAVQTVSMTLSGRAESEQLAGALVSPSLMPLLGLRPVVGRTFTADEEKPGAAPVAMISQPLWQRLGSDPRLVGAPLTIGGRAYTVVGIVPPAFNVLVQADLFLPLTIDPAKERRLNHVLFVAGRLKPGVSMAMAQQEMSVIAARDERLYPEMKDWGISLVTFTETFVNSQLRTALLVLLGAVLFVLLIVSANVANLLLSRAMERQREMAVRAAIGAGRAQLMRQLLTESLLLSGIGGALGIGAAVWAASLLSRTLPPGVLPIPDVGVDRTVLLVAVAVTLATGIIFGLAPAFHAARIDLNTALKDAGRSATAGRARLRQALAGGELALATVLLIGAALMIESLVALQHVPLGFDPEKVMTFQVSLPPLTYDPPRQLAFLQRLIGDVRTIPGVESAALTSALPFGGGLYTTSPFAAPGRSALPPDGSLPIDWRLVSSRYFATLRIPVVRGREFTDADTRTSPPVVIASQSAARALWGEDDPMGRTIRRVADGSNFTVVGVVGDVRSTTLNNTSPTVYFPAAWRSLSLMDIAVRTSGDPRGIVAAAREKVKAIDPQIPLANVRPLNEWISASAAQPRLNAQLLGIFAVVALLVAAIGTYGVLAYSVSRRTREFGLRMALGADRGGLVRLVMREGLSIGGAGILAGLFAAALLTRALSALVFGVSVWDPETFAAVPVILGAVAAAACLIPALRASRTDPMVALRD